MNKLFSIKSNLFRGIQIVLCTKSQYFAKSSKCALQTLKLNPVVFVYVKFDFYCPSAYKSFQNTASQQGFFGLCCAETSETANIGPRIGQAYSYWRHKTTHTYKPSRIMSRKMFKLVLILPTYIVHCPATYRYNNDNKNSVHSVHLNIRRLHAHYTPEVIDEVASILLLGLCFSYRLNFLMQHRP